MIRFVIVKEYNVIYSNDAVPSSYGYGYGYQYYSYIYSIVSHHILLIPFGCIL